MTQSTRNKFRLALFGTLALSFFIAPASAIELREQSGVQPLRPPSPPIRGKDLTTPPNDPRVHLRLPPLDPRVTGPGASHTQWCQNRYRSYRQSDNSYQPVEGIRQSCNSPFQ